MDQKILKELMTELEGVLALFAGVQIKIETLMEESTKKIIDVLYRCRKETQIHTVDGVRDLVVDVKSDVKDKIEELYHNINFFLEDLKTF